MIVRSPDDGWSANRAVAQLRAALDDDLAVQAHPLADGALHARCEVVENDAVGLEHVLQAAGVLPGRHQRLMGLDDQVRLHPAPAVDHLLDGVGDLELAARRVVDGIDGVENGVG